MIAINSRPDHVHLLLGMKPDLALSDLMREVKKSSSIFESDSRWVKGRFNWQPGFSAFSYSRSHLDAAVRYTQRQNEHHAQEIV